jgi:hypothetical protein
MFILSTRQSPLYFKYLLKRLRHISSCVGHFRMIFVVKLGHVVHVMLNSLPYIFCPPFFYLSLFDVVIFLLIFWFCPAEWIGVGPRSLLFSATFPVLAEGILLDFLYYSMVWFSCFDLLLGFYFPTILVWLCDDVLWSRSRFTGCF